MAGTVPALAAGAAPGWSRRRRSAGSRGGPATGRRLIALGWASHALFDLLQGPSDDSRLPAWYAPLCAGYDVAYAARLAR